MSSSSRPFCLLTSSYLRGVSNSSCLLSTRSLSFGVLSECSHWWVLGIRDEAGLQNLHLPLDCLPPSGFQFTQRHATRSRMLGPDANTFSSLEGVVSRPLCLHGWFCRSHESVCLKVAPQIRDSLVSPDAADDGCSWFKMRILACSGWICHPSVGRTFGGYRC